MRAAAADTGTAARALDPWNGAERAAAGASHARAHSWARAREGSGAAAALLPLPTRWIIIIIIIILLAQRHIRTESTHSVTGSGRDPIDRAPSGAITEASTQPQRRALPVQHRPFRRPSSRGQHAYKPSMNASNSEYSPSASAGSPTQALPPSQR